MIGYGDKRCAGPCIPREIREGRWRLSLLERVQPGYGSSVRQFHFVKVNTVRCIEFPYRVLYTNCPISRWRILSHNLFESPLGFFLGFSNVPNNLLQLVRRLISAWRIQRLQISWHRPQIVGNIDGHWSIWSSTFPISQCVLIHRLRSFWLKILEMVRRVVLPLCTQSVGLWGIYIHSKSLNHFSIQ